MVNPFTPGFGRYPAILAGRSAALADFDAALRGELPEQRAMLISGARGIGKTVLLSEFEAKARDAGWSLLPLHTGSSSLSDELRATAVARLRELDPDAVASHLTGAGASGFSASRSVTDRYAGQDEPLGDLLDRLAALAARDGHGVMIALDEVQSVDRAQLHEVSQHIQDLMRRHGQVVFVAAGIRSGVSKLLDHEKTTFLRRAHRLELGPVDIGTVPDPAGRLEGLARGRGRADHRARGRPGHSRRRGRRDDPQRPRARAAGPEPAQARLPRGDARG